MDVLYSGLVEEREASTSERKEERFSFSEMSSLTLGKNKTFLKK